MQSGLLFLMAALFSATENAPLVGTWNCSSRTAGGREREFVLEFALREGQLTGVSSDADNLVHVTGISFDGKLLSFLLPVEDDTYRIRAELDGERFEGEWTSSDDRGSIRGSRG
jgi:hypothetical protein